MGVERFTTTGKVSTKVAAVVGQVIDAVSAVLRYHTSLSKDDNGTLFTAKSPIVPVSSTSYSDVIINPASKLRTTDLSGFIVVPSYQPYFRSTLRINPIRNALNTDTSSLFFPLIATPLATGYVS